MQWLRSLSLKTQRAEGLNSECYYMSNHTMLSDTTRASASHFQCQNYRDHPNIQGIYNIPLIL